MVATVFANEKNILSGFESLFTRVSSRLVSCLSILVSLDFVTYLLSSSIPYIASLNPLS